MGFAMVGAPTVNKTGFAQPSAPKAVAFVLKERSATRACRLLFSACWNSRRRHTTHPAFVTFFSLLKLDISRVACRDLNWPHAAEMSCPLLRRITTV
ncbi:MAG: hypothetical protein P8010_12935 [Desulfosarcinaceae bacterium]|jgi:hypothetical protein